MTKILFTLSLVFGLIFTLNTGANALPMPNDEPHYPMGHDDFLDMPSDIFPDNEVPDIIEASGMISNLFMVGNEISFDYNFLTAEWDDYDGAIVNDFFGAFLMDSNQIIQQYFYIADMSDFTNGIITDAPMASTVINGETGTLGPHDSRFYHQTGVIHHTLDTSDNFGNVMFLGLGVFDVGDAEVDTGVIIDNITLPVPGGYFSGGLIGGGFAPSTVGDGPSEPPFIVNNGFNDMYRGNVHQLTEGDGSLSGVAISGDGSFFEGNYAYMSTGEEDMLPLTVVPEPISSALFLIGGATLGFRRYRKTIKN